MPWTCEYCGWENLQDDRIALEEPPCIRCSHRRGERTQNIQTLEFAIERITAWDKEYAAKIQRLTALYDSTWAELDRIAEEHDALVKEQYENSIDLQAKTERLEALKAINPAPRQMPEDQSTLQGVRA
jgi:hypothetical protein